LLSRQDTLPACQNQQYKSFGRKGEDARDDAAKERVKAHAKRALINILLGQENDDDDENAIAKSQEEEEKGWCKRRMKHGLVSPSATPNRKKGWGLRRGLR